MPKVSQEHLEARRRGILLAAQRCVARKGPAGTTMRDICKAANLSPGGVYRYFSSKTEILAALASERQTQVERFFRPLGGSTSDRSRLLAALESLAAALDDDSARDGLQLDLHLWSAALESEEIRQAVAEGNRRISAGLAGRLSGVAEGDAEALSRAVLALLQGLAVQRAVDPGIELREILNRARRVLAPR
jgi:AcrR family transcriptional regulator